MAGFYDSPPAGGAQTGDSLDGFYGESSVGESINDSIARAEAAADSAEASEVAAGISETNAATSEANAASSEANAAASESAAQSSAAAALVSENLSHKWAQNPEDVQVSGGEYSSYHWAQKALAAVISGGVVGPGAGTTTPGFIPLWGDTDGTSLLSGIDPATKANVSYVDSQDALKAPLDSPTFTGTPAAPTAAVDDTTTKLATTAFVVGQAASAVSPVNGTAAVGTSKRYARQDHVHGTDTTRAPLASPTFTGTPAAPTAALGNNTTQIATTAFVQNQTAQLSKSVAGGANVTLTATEAGNYHIVLTGAITANISVIVPIAIKKEYIFLDNTTGAYTITVKTPSGTGVVTPKATRMVVYCDGVNVVPVVRPQESVTDTTAGSLLRVGAFALGSIDAPTLNNQNLDLLSTNGLYYCTNPTNGPEATTLLVKVESVYALSGSERGLQWAVPVAASNSIIYVRQRFAGVWGAWQQVTTSASTRLAYGVPASAWDPGYRSIDIGWCGLASPNYDSVTILATNHYFDGTTYKYKNTGVAHNLMVGAYGGTPLVVQTAAWGSAGANIAFTDSMVLEATGDVTFGGNVKSGVIGTGQTWQDTTGSRAVNTNYTNSTGKPIEVQISCTSAPGVQGYFQVDGGNTVKMNYSSGASAGSIFSCIIPADSTYRLNTTSIVLWNELR